MSGDLVQCLTKQFLQNLPVVEILRQVLHDDPLSNQNIVDPVDQHLCTTHWIKDWSSSEFI